MPYLLIAAVLGLLITLHEFGHLLAAKLVGIPIARFSVGFGPILARFTRGGTEYRLAAIPLGGYVLPAIEDEAEFLAIPLRRRALFFLGGPAANIGVAVLGFALLNALVHGVTLHGSFVAPFSQTAAASSAILMAIPKLFTAPEAMSGIVGIVVGGGQFVGLDPARALQFTIMISLNLAVLNLLPLPILDGGRLLFHTIGAVFPKTTRWHTPLAAAGALLLIGLMLFATFMDLTRYFA